MSWTKILKLIATYLVGNILYLLSMMVPKSKKIWVFGAWGGNQYADNPKYLFEYVNEFHPEINAIWLTRQKEIEKKIESKGYKAFQTNSIKGIWYSCRAKVGAMSHGMIDLNRFACARMEIVQMWHGIPIKPILLSDPKKSSIAKRKLLTKLSFFFPFLKKELRFNENLIICSSSKHVSKILKKAFGSNSPIRITGFPRLDGFFRTEEENPLKKKIRDLQRENVRVGIYMPTWRQKGEFNIIKYLTENLQDIDKFLKGNKLSLFLRIHPFDQHELPKEFNFDCIHLITNEMIEGDIYSVLGAFDFLVSDYSSVIFDYLIKESPIYLMVPDRKDYIESNGKFVYDYKNIELPVEQSWGKLLPRLNEDNYQSQETITKLSSKYHKYKDGNSSKRLFDQIIKRA
ncbi:CDP-glycerol glycerophosphotransferase family protein [Gracilimonas tropica]|uniref:CDP-glycerol glycerophosphotransferase family protein n=1 Tax=Gracilimonas tropica TaxID=454600 RepID=UPI00037BAB0C|nr:CDP-glycerol glycerophosphotransferase family protein [Gracilimonas tropica]